MRFTRRSQPLTTRSDEERGSGFAGGNTAGGKPFDDRARLDGQFGWREHVNEPVHQIDVRAEPGRAVREVVDDGDGVGRLTGAGDLNPGGGGQQQCGEE